MGRNTRPINAETDGCPVTFYRIRQRTTDYPIWIGGAGNLPAMLDSPAVGSSASTEFKSSTGAIVAAAIGVLVCLFSHLGALGLVGPDEPRYAWIARNMASAGDWVTPRLYGQPWFEKPILYYWAAAVGFRLHLPAEWAARLPSALAALVAALAIGWLAWRHYGESETSVPNSALLAPLVFATSVGAIGFARSAGPDMLFSASLTLAMASAATVFRCAGFLGRSGDSSTSGTRRDALPLALFGATLGLGVLAKGPAAVILAGGAVGVWAFATRHWRIAFRLAHPIAVISFCVVALPWYIVCALRNPDFIRVFIFQHNFERYLTPVFQHKQPFWYFVPILILALLPWTVLLFPVAQSTLHQWREKSWTVSPGFFFACWGFFPLLFFSFSQSKLPGYILPAIPPLSLLLAVALARAIRSDSHASEWLLAIVGLTWILIGGPALWLSRVHTTPRFYPAEILGFGAAIAIVGGVSVAVFAFVRPRAALVLSFATVIAMVEFTGLRVLPALDSYISARSHEAFLRHDLRQDRLFTYHLSRSWNYGLTFYFGRELPEWSPADPEPALVLTNLQGFNEIAKLSRFHSGADDEERNGDGNPPRGILYVPVQPAPR
jgi:4-amino-4-deoxy-L-arabinose transferase-like glycosyltransferase